jgi:uncharacterized DUF497 family protein
MRFKFDRRKSEALKRNSKRGFDFEEAREVWEHPHYIDQRSDNPEQYRAIGWARGQLISVIFEVRNDSEGEYCRLVTLWRSTQEERKLYEENI